MSLSDTTQLEEHPGDAPASSRRDVVTQFAADLVDRRWMPYAVLAVCIALPLVFSSQYAIGIQTTAAIWVMLAVGLNIVVGYCGLLDLGYAAFFAIGAYTSGILSTRYGLSLIETIPFVLVVTVIAGLVIGAPTLRLRSDYLAIVTLGFGEIIRITANNLSVTGGPSGIYGIPQIEFAGYTVDSPLAFYYVTLGVVASAVVGGARLGKSRLGRAWKFVREDEDAAEAMGINTYTTKLAAYVLGAVWGGVAGVLLAAQISAVSPNSFKFIVSALILMAVVLGGMGSIPGVVLGALFISLAPELLREYSQWRFLIFGVLLVAVMIFRPRGVWPVRGSRRPR